MEKTKQLEVIKFLKSPAYQAILTGYNNKFQKKLDMFTAKYIGADDEGYTSNEPEYSEIAMQSRKYKIFESKLNDISDTSSGAILVKELIEEQMVNIKSQLLNSVTNGFGMSKDIATFTGDDIAKFEMLHEKDFHIFIVGMMNAPKYDDMELSLQNKYDIYDSPETNIADDEVEL